MCALRPFRNSTRAVVLTNPDAKHDDVQHIVAAPGHALGAVTIGVVADEALRAVEELDILILARESPGESNGGGLGAQVGPDSLRSSVGVSLGSHVVSGEISPTKGADWASARCEMSGKPVVFVPTDHYVYRYLPGKV